MDTNENKEIDSNIDNSNDTNISNNDESTINNITEERNSTTEKTINNKFIKFVDKHALGISILIGCIYVISSWFVTFSFLYINNAISIILLGAYYLFLLAYILLYIGLSIYYKNIKYFGYLLLGFLIGFFTCGGLFFIIILSY